jgi:hypothetical protein
MLRPLVFFAFAITLSGCTGLPSASKSSQVQSESVSVTQVAAPIQYTDYANILRNYVNDKGLVNYQALQTNAMPLKAFNAALGKVDSATYQSWTEADRLAFLINAYNSFTLESIIDQKPLKKSIRDIFGVWNGRKFELASQSKTLDNIEHQTIRKEFNEPRIHMALVCAAISCPLLRQEPYTGEKLEVQLDEQTQRFLSSPQGLRIDRDRNRVYLSSIFKWFGEDWQKSYAVADQFTGSQTERAVLNFVSNYVSEADRAYLRQGQYKINYLDYNWSLNIQ